jgi:hypothetical protein
MKLIKKGILLIIMTFLCFQTFAQKGDKIELEIIAEEYWWGGQ